MDKSFIQVQVFVLVCVALTLVKSTYTAQAFKDPLALYIDPTLLGDGLTQA